MEKGKGLYWKNCNGDQTQNGNLLRPKSTVYDMLEGTQI